MRSTNFSCFLGDKIGLITSDKNIIFLALAGNLIRPPLCLFPAQTRRPPFFDWALPEGQPNS